MRNRTLATVLLAAVLVGLLTAGHFLKTPEPSYLGRPLRQWLKAFDPSGSDTKLSRRDAVRAVAAIGTNGIPILVKLLGATDSPFKTKLATLLQKQHLVKVRFTTAADLHQEASTAFALLGVRAVGAVPALTNLYEQSPSVDTRLAILDSLQVLGPAASSAVPILEKAAAGTNSVLRNRASNMLNNLNLQRAQHGGYLPGKLSDPDLREREKAAIQLVYASNAGLGVSPEEQQLHEALPALTDAAMQSGVNNYWLKFLLARVEPDLAARVLTYTDPALNKGVAPATNPPEVAAQSANPGQRARLLGAGNWSETVAGTGNRNYKLRARLLLHEPPHYTNQFGEWYGNAAVSLELQDVTAAINYVPMAVYFDVQNILELELRDGSGAVVPPNSAIQGTPRQAYWAIVPHDGSVRLRADRATLASHVNPGALVIAGSRGGWRILPGDTNTYFLSATFNSATNHPQPLDYEVWAGKLTIPPVTIPAMRP